MGWNVEAALGTDVLLLQVLEMVAWHAGQEGHGSAGLVHHSDHGSNYMSLVYTNRIAELDATPSTKTISDSDDNALAKTVNALHKTELI